MQRLLVLIALSVVAAPAAAQEVITFPAIADNSIVMVDGEWSENAGDKGRIRIKGNQHIVVMNFDLSAVRGRSVRKAQLACQNASDAMISGVTISTIAVPWDEQTSNGLESHRNAGGWGAAGVLFPAVCGGNSRTLSHSTLTRLEGNTYIWDVSPEIIEAMISGDSHGLAIHEHDADYGRNPAIFSREQSGKKPQLVLELNGPGTAALKRPGLSTSSTPLQSGSPSEAATVEVPQLQRRARVSQPTKDICVLPAHDRYDRSGKAVGVLPDDYRTNNSLYDGRTVRITVAAGEVIGFQVLIRGTGRQSVSLKLDGEKWRTQLSQAVYVKSKDRMIPDPLLPFSGEAELQPDADTVLFADVYVPFEAVKGDVTGRILVGDGREIPVEITVLPVSLPRKATFVCEMNSYGLPDHVEDYYALQRMAYDHRVHLNILHYSHQTAAPGARKSNLDMRLRSGRRMDNRRYDSVQPGDTSAWWDDFAEAFAPVLDGSLFADGHRGPIPVPGFYLTFHESWPLNCRAHFNGNPDAELAFADSPKYAETFVSVLQSFVELAKKKRWTETGFQVYFNNKGSLSDPTRAPWVLDEPAGFWDYRALGWYGRLYDRGRMNASDINISYRIDISRPEFTRNQLDGRKDLWVVAGAAFKAYRLLVQERQRRDKLTVWVYGSANPVEASSRSIDFWILDAWLGGATGVVPWQTVDKSGDALSTADPLGLFIMDKGDAERPIVRSTLRLKAFLQSQQLAEKLMLLRSKRNLSHADIEQLLGDVTQTELQIRKDSDEDAGTAVPASEKPRELDEVRAMVNALL